MPDLPANGDLLTMKFMDSVGSSMWIISSGCGSAGSQMVSPMRDVRNTGYHDDIACFRLVHRHPLQSSVDEYLIDLLLFDLTVSLCYRHSAVPP